MQKDVQNSKRRKVINLIYCLLLHIVSFFILINIWIPLYCPWWFNYDKLFENIMTLLFLYAVVFYIFARLYSAYRINNYRIADMIFALFLTLSLSNIITYFEGCIYFRKIISIGPFVLIHIEQLIVSSLLAILFHKMYVRYSEKMTVLIITGNNKSDRLLEKLMLLQNHQSVRKIVSQNEQMDKLYELVDQCDALYLINTNEQIRKEFLIYCQSISKPIYITESI